MSTEEVQPPKLRTLNPWQGLHERIFSDTTEEIDVEGARMSAKTTLCLDKEIHWLATAPGIRSFLFRYSDTDTKTKLKPAIEEIAYLRGLELNWNEKELCYQCPNGSKAYAFGLKAANASARYSKLRGQDVSRVYSDQSEELPADIGEEIRASLRQPNFPHQITFSPNPVNHSHWLASKRHGGFPEDNSILGRRYYGLSLYDNAYNLPPESIEMMERTYPPDHAKHRPMILGKRGLNVIGNAVYEDIFQRSLHVKGVKFDPDSLLLEAFDFGRHNTAWVIAQRLYAGGLAFLGGIIGEGLFLDAFVPTVKKYRAEWFPDIEPNAVRTCCPPPGSSVAIHGNRFTNHTILRSNGFYALFRPDANSADVQLALVERIAGYMTRLSAPNTGCLIVNSDDTKWLKVSREGIGPCPFIAQAFEAGYVWDEHWRSVANAELRHPKNDDWFANGMRCVENIELNFCATMPTQSELDALRRGEANAVDRDYIQSLYRSAWH